MGGNSRLRGAGLCRAQGGIDLRPNAARRQCGKTRLRSAGLNLVAEFVPPFPNVWFRRSHDRKLDASVDHGNPLFIPRRWKTTSLNCNQSGQLRVRTNYQMHHCNPGMWGWFLQVPISCRDGARSASRRTKKGKLIKDRTNGSSGPSDRSRTAFARRRPSGASEKYLKDGQVEVGGPGAAGARPEA